ncbi:hypothetical protein [Microvirgula aerodenitrificans]|uniref:hypothetical protein n=1 Tax=Microvirgula aerodenitrificans TaxID=57480 RepID=UPI0012EC3F54|nr:hypothetical protein [Microvirgula aerodenitrificans]
MLPVFILCSIYGVWFGLGVGDELKGKGDVWKFILNYLSGNHGGWGTFGDFAGGTLHSILATLTLIVTVKNYRKTVKSTERSNNIQKTHLICS